MAATMDAVGKLNRDALVNILSIFCVVCNSFVKFPQIKNVVSARSVKGLSISGVLMETVVFMVGMLYYFVNDFPLMVYAEYITLEIQALLMVLICIYYEDGLDVRILPMAAVFFFLSGLIGSASFPRYVIAFLFSMNTPLTVVSKLLQFHTIYKAKNSGSASLITWAILGLTSAARIVTTLIVKPDILVITNFTVSATLNLLVCSAIVYYRPSAKKFD